MRSRAGPSTSDSTLRPNCHSAKIARAISSSARFSNPIARILRESGQRATRWAIRSSPSGLLSPFQGIANAADSFDPARRLSIVVELLAQRRDEDVDGTVEDFEVAISHFKQQLLARLHAAGGARESQKQIELLAREGQRCARERGGMRVRIDA